jgi:hypothetical protein
MAPLSTSRVTSHTPVFHWTLGAGEDGAEVEICKDRACRIPVANFVASGSSGSPQATLSRGVYFWRVRGMASGAVGTQTSAVWEFFVGARSAMVNTSWGTSLDVNGDGYGDVAVGAYLAAGGAGETDVYLGGPNGIATAPAALPIPDRSLGQDGYSVASAGDVNGDGFGDLVVGAPGAGAQSGGNVYVYLGGADGISKSAISLFQTAPYAYALGTSVAGAGDVNGDGYADIILASGNTNEQIYVSLGGPNGPGAPTVFIKGFAYQGVAAAGDVNGDGYADVVVGPFDSPASAGTAYLYLGGPSGLSQTAITLAGPGAPPGSKTPFFSSYGAVAGAGDVNGDGYADVVVGAEGVNAAYVYLGGANGPSSSPFTLVGPGASMGQFGVSVAGAGDVNGDGFADIVVGAIFENQSTGLGAAYVFLGTRNGPSSTPVSLVDPGAPLLADAGVEYDLFGAAVGGGADVNGDTLDDIVVGAYDINRSYVFLGRAGGVATSSTALAGASGRFGGAVTE